MEGRLQAVVWDFAVEELCFNCRSEAVQEIEVAHRELVTRCTNCGAEAHYAQYCSCEGPEGPPPAAAGMEYGAWRFVHSGRCPRCGEETPNDMAVDAATGVIVCGRCRFVRLYRLDMFNKRWR